MTKLFWGSKPSIYLIGIGGSGMSGIAEVLLATDFAVSGSDLAQSPTLERLEALGAKIFIGHRAEQVRGATCVVVSTAVHADNPECMEAQRLNIPIIPRAEMLAELMRLKMGIAVAGSHGKTTTTSMLGQFLQAMDPTVVVGGRLQHWNASSIVGRGRAFVIEADESDRSFLKFSPVYSVVTNIDREHMDTYSDLGDIERTFLTFLNKTAFFGMNWICADCPQLRKLMPEVTKPTRTYGFHPDADLRIRTFDFRDGRSFFELEEKGKSIGPFELSVPGKHNIQNATAAIGLSLALGMSVKELKERTQSFVPADRRLQLHAENATTVIIEDYGHHPTEIRGTLEAVRVLYPKDHLRVIFQPHRYSRTKALLHEFAPSFSGLCNDLWILPVYAAHEAPIPGADSEALRATFNTNSSTPSEVRSLDHVPMAAEIFSTKKKDAREIILILGAGPLTSLAHQLAECVRLEEENRIDELRHHQG